MGMGSKLEPEQVDEIYRLLGEGKTCVEVAKIVGCGRTTVSNYRKMLISHKSTDKSKWLDDNWHFTGRVLAVKPKYRKVRKGEMGKIRTPYRPDGRFI